MKPAELRDLSAGELEGKIRQWKDDRFRFRFRASTSETKDTSLGRKLRRDIARAKTVLSQKHRSTQTAEKGTLS